MTKTVINVKTGERLTAKTPQEEERLKNLRGNPNKPPKNWAYDTESIPVTDKNATFLAKAAEAKVTELEEENARLKAMLAAAQQATAEETPAKRGRKNLINTEINSDDN